MNAIPFVLVALAVVGWCAKWAREDWQSYKQENIAPAKLYRRFADYTQYVALAACFVSLLADNLPAAIASIVVGVMVWTPLRWLQATSPREPLTAYEAVSTPSPQQI